MIHVSQIPALRRRASRLLPATFAAACLATGFVMASDDPRGGDSGGNPTVGTLPMQGDDDDTLDQTVTLRGRTQDIRAAIASATGEGSYDVVPLPNGEAWIRFFGDVRIELRLDALSDLELGIFAGFDGGGMAYAVETLEGFGAPRLLQSGYSISLDPIRSANAGLLEGPIDVHGYHRSGDRTRTRVSYDVTAGRLLVQQDV